MSEQYCLFDGERAVEGAGPYKGEDTTETEIEGQIGFVEAGET